MMQPRLIGHDSDRVSLELLNPLQRLDLECRRGAGNRDLPGAFDVRDSTVKSRNQLVQFANGLATWGLGGRRGLSHRGGPLNHSPDGIPEINGGASNPACWPSNRMRSISDRLRTVLVPHFARCDAESRDLAHAFALSCHQRLNSLAMVQFAFSVFVKSGSVAIPC
jgi:hypothetical protein